MTRQVQEVHDREGEVVVYCSMEYSTRSDGQMVAARIRKLGLTGYGRKLEQAEEAVTELFVCMVESHRSEGILAQHLNNLEDQMVVGARLFSRRVGERRLCQTH